MQVYSYFKVLFPVSGVKGFSLTGPSDVQNNNNNNNNNNESFEDYVDPIQEVIEDLLLPTLFGQSEPLPNEVRRLATLATGQGGLGIPDLKTEAQQQFAASRLITTAHVDSITSQSYIMVPGERVYKIRL